MNRLEYERAVERLQEKRPINLTFLSANDARHFFGSMEEWDRFGCKVEDDTHFDCEIKFYQEDSETNVCFRHVCARVRDGEIVSFETKGLPEEFREEFKRRCLISYKLTYPEGIDVEELLDV